METVPVDGLRVVSLQRQNWFQQNLRLSCFKGALHAGPLRLSPVPQAEIFGNMWQSRRLVIWQSGGSRIRGFSCMELETAMKDFSNAAFSPDLIEVMDE